MKRAAAGNKKRKRQVSFEESNEENAEDVELQAEIEALRLSRAEKGLLEQESAITDKQPISISNNIYNSAALLKCVEDMGTVNLPFLETLQISEFSLEIVDENDDLDREMMFYNHSLEAALAGRSKLSESGVPIHRPDDYFCENVKDDAHMAKIKDRLLLEEKRIEAFELRKNRENNRKFNKQVSELRKQEKVKDRKSNISEFSKLRKGSSESNSNSNSEQADKPQKNSISNKSPKRMAMDRKYGSGIKEKMRAKLSDKKSFEDMSSFNPRGGEFIRRDRDRGRGRANAKAKGGNRRPGKEARTKQRKSRAGGN